MGRGIRIISTYIHTYDMIQNQSKKSEGGLSFSKNFPFPPSDPKNTNHPLWPGSKIGIIYKLRDPLLSIHWKSLSLPSWVTYNVIECYGFLPIWKNDLQLAVIDVSQRLSFGRVGTVQRFLLDPGIHGNLQFPPKNRNSLFGVNLTLYSLLVVCFKSPPPN
jgi:hypothetical protein